MSLSSLPSQQVGLGSRALSLEAAVSYTVRFCVWLALGPRAGADSLIIQPSNDWRAAEQPL